MAKTDNSYRIHTNIGVDTDTVLHVKLDREIDFLEILTLKLAQKDLYKLHASNRGVIVGRVLANEGFGIPNVRISVFVKLSNEDARDNRITSIYPYTSTSSKDNENRRYNLLPDTKRNDCYRIVGTFPNKRLVLDDDTQIEIFDDYWKYTTVTNAAGDYMIFGVPTGMQTVHADVDLSNIGILSQKPRDFVYKGYNITSFDNASQFKESTNLDNLVQIIGQDQPANVYPFWGDNDAEGVIGITRVDINISYKFETTCIFMGSIISDDQTNNLSHECSPSKKIGYNRTLTTSEGTIEMIRHTLDGLVEETQIQGNQLIDGDGVWCYQIPMNLDYVVTDEYGNIVPTDNPNKGIPTRTSVRFRFSVNETGSEGVARHRAEYLVPNNPMPENDKDKDGKWSFTGSTVSFNKKFVPRINSETWNKFEQNYEFGSATPEHCFRDLFWNKVYTVKNYIPRIQANAKANTDEYLGIRSVNYNDSKAPFPYNNVRFKLPFNYVFLCILMEIFFVIVAAINASLISILRIICIGIPGLKLFGVKLYWYPFDFLECIHFSIEDDEAGDGSTIMYAPGCWGRPPKGAVTDSMGGFSDRMQRGLAQESEVVNYDFGNDWINGALYMPLWFWRKTKKKKYFFGLFSKRAVNKFCNASEKVKKLKLAQVSATKIFNPQGTAKNIHKKISLVNLKQGVIYEKVNKDDLRIYYYTPIQVLSEKGSAKLPFVRLFATDIVLLGSFADCDLDSMPQMFDRLPASTANIPSFVSTRILTDEENLDDPTVQETSPISLTGMDWTHHQGKPPKMYAGGLLLDLSCASVTTVHKSIVNTRRLCELGVTYDGTYEKVEKVMGDGTIIKREIEPDGLITRIEIEDLESRAMFATLNGNGLDVLIPSPVTKYNTYKLDYLYPTAFDGDLAEAAQEYTKGQTKDEANMSYLKFRYGTDGNWRWGYNETFPMFNNSYYFYFGSIPGKTALEKFYKNFYSECFNNQQEPFSVEITTKPGSWCVQDAHFEVNLNSIRAPYSFKLYDALGKPFIEGNELEYKILKFDLWDYNDKYAPWEFAAKVIENIDCTATEWESLKNNYVEDYQNKYNDIANQEGYFRTVIDEATIMNGGEPEFITGEYHYYSINLTNGMYTLEITDSYGRNIKNEVDLLQSPLTVSITSKNLSDKYEVGSFVDEASSGKIAITSMVIDGEEYRFKPTSIDDCIISNDGDYLFKVYKIIEMGDGMSETTSYRFATDDEFCDESECDDSPWDENSCGVRNVKFSIKQTNKENDPNVNSFGDTIFNTNLIPELVDYSKYADVSGSIYDDDNVVGGDNINEESKALVFNVKTADDFYIEAIEYCCGKESDNIFNTRVSIASSDPISLKFAEVDYMLLPKIEGDLDNRYIKSLWVNINDPNHWRDNFPTYDINTDSASLWAEWVSGITDLEKAQNAIRNNDGSVDDDTMETYKSSIKKAVAFMLDCILKVSKAVACENTPVTLKFTYAGGSEPVMYTAYPNYSNLSPDNTNTKKLNRYISNNSVTTIQCDYNYPTVINDNYYTDTSFVSKDMNRMWNLNSIFHTSELGHYAGVIDANNPNKTAPPNIKAFNISDINPTMTDIKPKENYYMVHTVDRRVDCVLHIGKGVNSVVVDPESVIFGGIALGYDKDSDYSIVAPVDNLEFISNPEYTDENGDKNIVYTEYIYTNDNYKSLTLNRKAKKRYYNIYFYTEADMQTGYNLQLENDDPDRVYWEYAEDESGDNFPVFRLHNKKPLILTKGVTFNWDIESCSYNPTATVGVEYTTIQDTVDEDTEVSSIKISNEKVLATTSAGSTIEGIMSTSSSFGNVYETFYDIVKNNSVNVQFKKNVSNGDNIKWLDFKYKVNSDDVTDATIYTNAPIMIEGDVNDIKDEEIVDFVKENYVDNVQKTDIIFAEGYDETYQKWTKSPEGTLYVTDPSNQIRLPDDDELRSVTHYKFYIAKDDLNKPKILCLQREYISSTFTTSHLGNKVFTYEVAQGPDKITQRDANLVVNTLNKNTSFHFRVMRGMGSSFPKGWEQYGELIGLVVKDKDNGGKKQFSWVRVYVDALVDKETGELIPDVATDSVGNWLLGCRVAGTDVYTESKLLGFVCSETTSSKIYDKNRKLVSGTGGIGGIGDSPTGIKYAYFIIPFYSATAVDYGDEDEDDDDDGGGGADPNYDPDTDIETGEVFTVKPIWYEKKMELDVVFKRRTNGIYYNTYLTKNKEETKKFED